MEESMVQREVGKSNIIFHSCLDWSLGDPRIVHRIVAGAGKAVWTDFKDEVMKDTSSLVAGNIYMLSEYCGRSDSAISEPRRAAAPIIQIQ